MTLLEMRKKGISEAVNLIREVGTNIPDTTDESVICFVLDLFLGTTAKRGESYYTPTFLFTGDEPTEDDIVNAEMKFNLEAIKKDGKLIGFRRKKAL